jgi:hypothetical protein
LHHITKLETLAIQQMTIPINIVFILLKKPDKIKHAGLTIDESKFFDFRGNWAGTLET